VQNPPRHRPGLLLLPLLAAGVLVGIGLLPRAQQNAALVWSLWGTAGALIANALAIGVGAVRGVISIDATVDVKRTHWVQGALQASIYVYWGSYWAAVPAHALLIVAQIVFLYALHMMIAWSRGKAARLGFGPFPIVLSTNLFLWFRDDWFYLQFAMLAVGAFAKDLITWEYCGRRRHIFNPSAFALALFSLVLIASDATGMTWGPQIATTLVFPEYFYVHLFALGIVVQYLFRVTLVTLCAAATIFLVGTVYEAATGIYWFVTASLPASVFIGLHLLVTDPATSPRSDVGRAIFGALYGASVLALFSILEWMGAPTFYDKLLSVPLLNLAVPWLDRLAGSIQARVRLPALSGSAGNADRSNLALMAVWSLLFLYMWTSGFVSPRHEGRTDAFWQQACLEQKWKGCHYLHEQLERDCADDEPASCFNLGVALAQGHGVEPDPVRAQQLWQHACSLGLESACEQARR
jgi:hypothetical protein